MGVLALDAAIDFWSAVCASMSAFSWVKRAAWSWTLVTCTDNIDAGADSMALMTVSGRVATARATLGSLITADVMTPLVKVI
jgi:hypothetical protein